MDGNVGRIGEDIASIHLQGKGFLIEERNYRKPYGEIDIIASRNGKIHFVEVKTVTREIKGASTRNGERFYFSQETDAWIPEENVHHFKLRRLRRVIGEYVLKLEADQDWQFDVLAVFLDRRNRKAVIRVTADVPLGE